MRNLLKYPLNVPETIEYLRKLKEDVSYEKTGLIGDMSPVIVDMLYKYITQFPETYLKFIIENFKL